MTDLLITGIILLILGAVVAYLWKSKKSGIKCIGCPSGCKCSEKSHSVCHCGCHNAEKMDEAAIGISVIRKDIKTDMTEL